MKISSSRRNCLGTRHKSRLFLLCAAQPLAGCGGGPTTVSCRPGARNKYSGNAHVHTHTNRLSSLSFSLSPSPSLRADDTTLSGSEKQTGEGGNALPASLQ
ncbi:hypothetical protein PoB_002199400 [Plakobranchus ocellatus]|uniref:Secreted protein n=1 Tax=Plakobranchus ocellatus TaxID=259542 RepID=A0AAV3ZJI6_9GAST|nr:hypothetical protein PoB_002199400 [Plakobranchus ocellatus]